MLILLNIIVIAFPHFFAAFNGTTFDYTSHHSWFAKLNLHGSSKYWASRACRWHRYKVLFFHSETVRIGNSFDSTAGDYLDNIFIMLNKIKVLVCRWGLVEWIVLQVEVNKGLTNLLYSRNDFGIECSFILIIFRSRPSSCLNVLFITTQIEIAELEFTIIW